MEEVDLTITIYNAPFHTRTNFACEINKQNVCSPNITYSNYNGESKQA